MKPVLAATLFLMASLATVEALPPATAGDPKAVSSWLASLGARREGGETEGQVFGALRRWFSSQVEIKTQTFNALDGEHSFSQQLWFHVAGTRPGELIVVTPTDGTNDHGLAWASSWAAEALAKGSPVSVTFVFTGAERFGSKSLGSRTFLQDFYPSGPCAVIYLDTVSANAECRLITESGSYPSPLWMVRNLSRALRGQTLSVQFAGSAPSLFRLDLPSRQNALAPWFERGIPGIWLSSGTDDREVVQALRDFAAATPQGIPSEWDRHYLAFDLGPALWFWGQETYLMVFLATSALLLFGYALLGRRRRGSFRLVTHEAWQLPVLFSLTFLSLWFATVLSQELFGIRSEPDFWQKVPLLTATFKGFVALTIYVLALAPLARAPLSHNPDFYGQAALVLLGVMTVTAAAIELSFSFYFLWALVCCAAALVLPWRWVRSLTLILGPLWLFKAAYDVLGPTPDGELSRWVLISPIAGNLVVAGLIFPFLLQVHAWYCSSRHYEHRHEGLQTALRAAVFALGALSAALLIVAAPATESLSYRPASGERSWSTHVSHWAFLDRTVWSIELSSRQWAESIETDVESNQSLVVYDCNFPVVLEPDGHHARVVIGRQPPLPLTIRLTLPATTAVRLTFKTSLERAGQQVINDVLDLVP